MTIILEIKNRIGRKINSRKIIIEDLYHKNKKIVGNKISHAM